MSSLEVSDNLFLSSDLYLCENEKSLVQKIYFTYTLKQISEKRRLIRNALFHCKEPVFNILVSGVNNIFSYYHICQKVRISLMYIKKILSVI